jgi:hypothetical protein
MLPDFPKIKGEFVRVIDRYLQELVRQEPLLSQIQEERDFEGNKMSSKTEDGGVYKSAYKEISGQYSIKREDVIAKGPMAFMENIQSIAEKLKEQKAKDFFDKLREVVDETGNVVNGKEQSFTFELFMEGLEKIWIDFDDEGNPSLPTVVVSPELGMKLKDLHGKPTLSTRRDSRIL